jgi:hypothetical protein
MEVALAHANAAVHLAQQLGPSSGPGGVGGQGLSGPSGPASAALTQENKDLREIADEMANERERLVEEVALLKCPLTQRSGFLEYPLPMSGFFECPSQRTFLFSTNEGFTCSRILLNP